MVKVSEGGVGGVSSFQFLRNTKHSTPSLRLCSKIYCIAVVVCWCVSYDNRHRITCSLLSLTTEPYYFVLIVCVTATTELSGDERLVVGEYTLRHHLQRDGFGHRCSTYWHTLRLYNRGYARPPFWFYAEREPVI